MKCQGAKCEGRDAEFVMAQRSEGMGVSGCFCRSCLLWRVDKLLSNLNLETEKNLKLVLEIARVRDMEAYLERNKDWMSEMVQDRYFEKLNSKG